jgi:hypothetical protein
MDILEQNKNTKSDPWVASQFSLMAKVLKLKLVHTRLYTTDEVQHALPEASIVLSTLFGHDTTFY